MPPQRASCPEDIAIASAIAAHPFSAADRSRPLFELVPPTARGSSAPPEEYFASLRAAVESAPRTGPFQVHRVDRSKVSRLHEVYDVMRTDGVKFRVTPQFLVLFYDLTVPQAEAVLGLTHVVMRRLRVWCGLSRWPRQVLLDGKHPVLRLSAVREERLEMMRWAYQNRQEFLYAMLHAAHRLASCDTEGLPSPAKPLEFSAVLQVSASAPQQPARSQRKRGRGAPQPRQKQRAVLRQPLPEAEEDNFYTSELLDGLDEADPLPEEAAEEAARAPQPEPEPRIFLADEEWDAMQDPVEEGEASEWSAFLERAGYDFLQ
jgi:hypothetical protein